MLNFPKKAAAGAATLVAVLGAGGTAWAVESAATSGGTAPAAGWTLSGFAGATSAATGTPTAPDATTPDATTPAATGPNARGARRRIADILRRADHATAEIRTKTGWETVTLDRGRVTASTATSITLLRPDGQSVTEAVTSSTNYRGPGSIAVVGKPAIVVSLNGSALDIAQAGARAGARAGAKTGAQATPNTGASSPGTGA